MISKNIVLVFAVLVFLVLLANNILAPTPTAPWYEVEDWEKEVCSKWGGTQFSGQEAVVSGRKLSFAALTATAQARRFRSPEGFYQYEVAWYLDSFSQLTDYEIVLFDSSSPEAFRRVASGSLQPGAGTTGFEVYNLTQDYSHLRLKYSGGQVVSPVVRVR